MRSCFKEKMHLSAKSLLKRTRCVVEKIKEKEKGNQGKQQAISLTDCLMSAVAMFKLKFPSLLQFEKAKAEEPIKQNLKNLFGLENIPSDTYMRERLDEVDPEKLRPAFTSCFSAVQRGKQLEKYRFLDEKYLLLVDGTGFFSSTKIHCKNCCEARRKDGSIRYYHQMLGAVIAHPDFKEVLPICPEPIMKEDGATKNDCERNAATRLLKSFRREHPHLPVVIVEDALSANGPHLTLLKELNMNFIIVVKPNSNKALFDWVETIDWEKNNSKGNDSQGSVSFLDEREVEHRLKFVNNVALNNSHKDLMVNFLEHFEVDKKGKVLYHNTWITDTIITQHNAYEIARGGRARWRIENETFNTLKNQGYQFEHNFGHGYKNLSSVFSQLMMLVFLIDQIEQLCCGLFQGALRKMESRKSYLWRRIRGLFEFYIIESWTILYKAITAGLKSYVVPLNTS